MKYYLTPLIAKSSLIYGTLPVWSNLAIWKMSIMLILNVPLSCLTWPHQTPIATLRNCTWIWSKFVQLFKFVWRVTKLIWKIGYLRPVNLLSTKKGAFSVMAYLPNQITNSRNHLSGWWNSGRRWKSWIERISCHFVTRDTNGSLTSTLVRTKIRRSRYISSTEVARYERRF